MPRRRRVTKRRRVRLRSSVPPYPGHYLKEGSTDRDSTRLVQERLNQLGCGPVPENGIFDSEITAAVQLFQARSVDSQGQSLKIDGIVGPVTWAALFGAASEDIGEAVSPLVKRTLIVAATQVGVREDPLGSNSGPRVDEYLEAVGVSPGNPWCAAFVYWVFKGAASELGLPNPAIRTAGVLDHWKKAGRQGITRLRPEDVQEDYSLLRRGLIFVINTGGGKGHMGIVDGLQDDRLITIEGNTNSTGGREGIGVFIRESRKLSDINTGFISYDA